MSDERTGRCHSNGYRFGPGNYVNAPSKVAAAPLPLTVEGVSFSATGFELLAGDGTFVAWFEDVLDAVDALKVLAGTGKVVRCRDRALIKIRRVFRRRS